MSFQHLNYIDAGKSFKAKQRDRMLVEEFEDIPDDIFDNPIDEDETNNDLSGEIIMEVAV